MDILALLACLPPAVPATTLRQLRHIVQALLTMTGRVTMTGLARWTDTGGSYRTIQRFFATTIPWAAVFWLFFRRHLYAPAEVYLLVGDEVVVTKAGKHTYGLDRFFAGLFQHVVPGVAFFSLALVSTTTRRAFPLRLEQVVRTAEEKAASHAKTAAKHARPPAAQGQPGRPKGSRNHPKTAPLLSPELQRIKTMITAQLQLIGADIPLAYLALDGHFGNSPALQMVRDCGLQLISKLRADAALYFPYDGPYAGRGPHRKYGAKLQGPAIPDRYLRATRVAAGIETRTYQAQLLHKEFAAPLNVVILVKTNLLTQAHSQVLLFSSDLALPYEQVIEYYSLRCQIEFTCRDAKQYWGLEDFMQVTETGGTNAANLALFMVSLSAVLLADLRQTDPQCSVLDLKADYRGYKYVAETIKMLPQKPDADLIVQLVRHVGRLGRYCYKRLSSTRFAYAQLLLLRL
ncbi:MAG: transposase [Chloroflexota bacterium]|nr:transposase [Chloroflexota bacterium]